jgi:pyridoxal phosphate enzyme (YggS family)
MQIAERLAGIRANIDAALRRAGDPERDVTIVAVTKTHPAAVVDAVAAAGLLDVGENRVQEALAKAPDVTAAVRWHLIGHLQRNKVRAALRLFRVIHSVDSERLVEALGATGERVSIFLQVNVSGERSKYGASPESARGLWRAALAHDSLDVAGLMTMAPYSEDPEAARPVFRALRELRDDLDRTGDGPPLRLLSMGMSGDYEVAVAEGATHVRIGSALLGRNAG